MLLGGRNILTFAMAISGMAFGGMETYASILLYQLELVISGTHTAKTNTSKSP